VFSFVIMTEPYASHDASEIERIYHIYTVNDYISGDFSARLPYMHRTDIVLANSTLILLPFFSKDMT
jgi:hypothetical protein